MKKIIAIAGLTLSAVALFVCAPSQSTRSGAKVVAKTNGWEATLSLRNYDSRTDGKGWWGGSEGSPERVVQNLLVVANQRRINIDRSAFADLSNPRKASWTIHRDHAVLVIIGGDAADSYRCFLTFRKGKLTERRVEDGEFPKNFYEMTQYTAKPVPD